MPRRHDAVVGRFIKDGRLVIMPSKRSKLLLVLDHIAQEFEPGRTYPEPEVNKVLERYHADSPPCAATSSTRGS